MKKAARGIFIAVLLLCMAFAAPGYAATVTQDCVEVTLTTDRKAYDVGDKINVDLTIKNHGEAEIADVSVDFVVPDFCVSDDGSRAESVIAAIGSGKED